MDPHGDTHISEDHPQIRHTREQIERKQEVDKKEVESIWLSRDRFERIPMYQNEFELIVVDLSKDLDEFHVDSFCFVFACS